MSFFERVKEIGLPLDSVIVIGSGVLAAHGIRDARDVDMVVTKDCYAVLERDASWKRGLQGSSSCALEKGDVEVWLDWSTDGSGHPTYEDLLPDSEVIESVRCVTLDYLEKRKAERGDAKDIEDIRSIHEYRQNT